MHYKIININYNNCNNYSNNQNTFRNKTNSVIRNYYRKSNSLNKYLLLITLYKLFTMNSSKIVIYKNKKMNNFKYIWEMN